MSRGVLYKRVWRQFVMPVVSVIRCSFQSSKIEQRFSGDSQRTSWRWRHIPVYSCQRRWRNDWFRRTLCST